MPNQSDLIKLSLVVLAVLSGPALGYWTYQTFQAGREAERAEWQEKEVERTKKLGLEIAESVKRLNAQRDEQINSINEALDYANESKEKLDADINQLRADNNGLWISIKKCRNDTVSRKTEDPENADTSTGRIRLPETTEQHLFDLAADAQRVVIQYETCRNLLMPLVDLD